MTTKRPAKKAPAKAGAGNGEYTAPAAYTFGGITLRLPDSPLTPDTTKEEGIPRLVTDSEYREKALSSMRGFLEFADRVERGDDSLTPMERIWIAGAVRAYASQIYLKPPRKGPEPEIDPAQVIPMLHEKIRGKGLNKTSAVLEVADELGKSDKAIWNLLKRYPEQIAVLEEFFWGTEEKK